MKKSGFLCFCCFAIALTVFASCKKDDPKVIFSRTSLIAYYPFDGNANDLSDNSYHGIIHGAVPTEGRNGVNNGAYLFDGFTNYIELPSSMALNTDSCFSIEAWIFNYGVTSDGKYFDNAIFGQSDGESGSDYPVILLDIENDNSLRGAIRGIDNPPLSIKSLQKVRNNRWTHIVMVRNSRLNNLSIYINGALGNESDLQLIGNTATNDHISIGGYFDDLQYMYHFFYGKIDLVRIWNKPLSGMEILNLMTENYGIE